LAEFKPAVDLALGHEGGFTDNPKDPGNWTGGRVGVGILKGTNWGISAATYPHLDIKNLTREGAVYIYNTNWWIPGGYAGLSSQELANKVFSFAINGSRQEAIELLQIAVSACGVRVDIDGTLGPQTLAAANSTGKPGTLLIAYKSGMAARYDCITDMNRAMRWARDGWFNRAFA
jgi:lysozyme family protein